MNEPIRRFAIRIRAAIVIAFCACLGTLAAQNATPARPPNVIVILTDDQGWGDAGCYGATDLQTPNIDAIARRGVRFTQFCAAAPVCSPSRAGLLTGRYPPRAGMPSNGPSEHGKAGMPASQVTIAEMMKQAGYATAHIGKWHLGYTPETMPNAQGFDYSFGHMGGCIDNFSHFFYWQGPNRHDLWRNGEEVQMPGEYFPDLMVREAGEFMEKNAGKPFFLYFAANVPHYPYQGDPNWLERYKDLPYPRNLYAAFLSTLDERIGQLLARVESLGLTEETIVIFQSDHGYSTEERAHFGGGSSGKFRGTKFSLFEGGFRVPAIISWPGKIPAGEVREQLAHGCDWLPTIAELTGAKVLNPDLDGKSLVPVIRSETAPSPHSVLHWISGDSWAVREGPWKLIMNPTGLEKGSVWLSNLETDDRETRNFADDEPEQVTRLEVLHQEWARQARKQAL